MFSAFARQLPCERTPCHCLHPRGRFYPRPSRARVRHGRRPLAPAEAAPRVTDASSLPAAALSSSPMRSALTRHWEEAATAPIARRALATPGGRTAARLRVAAARRPAVGVLPATPTAPESLIRPDAAAELPVFVTPAYSLITPAEPIGRPALRPVPLRMRPQPLGIFGGLGRYRGRTTARRSTRRRGGARGPRSRVTPPL